MDEQQAGQRGGEKEDEDIFPHGGECNLKAVSAKHGACGLTRRGQLGRMKPEKVKFMLMAADMKRAVRFYRDVIGLDEIFVSDFWTELRFGDAIVALHGGHDGSRNPTGLSLQYADVLAMAEKIAEGGAKILQAPEQREGEPILLGVFRDAEGNEVFMTQYIG